MPNYYTSTETVLPDRADYPTASFLEVAVADFTGDGKTDVVLSYFSFPFQNIGIPIRLLAGNGAGGLTDITATAFPNGAPQTVFSRQDVIADFNNDGRPDLFLAGHGIDIQPFPGEHNGLLLSSGVTGVLNASDHLPAIDSNFTHSAAAADINHDGNMDLFVNNASSGAPYFLLGDGHGGFTRDDSRLPAGVPSTDRWDTVTFLDVDHDGDADMFLGTSYAANIPNRLLLNDGTGHFSLAANVPLPTTPQPIGQTQAIDSVAADLNGDGWPDLIVHYTLYAPASGALGYTQVLINQQNNTFVDETVSRLPASMEFITNFNRVAVVDMNGDGYPDLLASRNTGTPLYLNDGTGHFVQMPQGTIPFQAFSSQYAGDFNGDGRMDLVADYGHFNGAEHFRVLLAIDPALIQTGTDVAEGFMGDASAETISGLGGDDVIFSGGGNDSVSGGMGNDTVQGGEGQNYLRGDEGNDSIHGGSGFDDINGNKGDDTIDGGSAGDDWLVGGQGNDLITAHSGFNILYGNLGNDTLHGGANGEWLRGGQGDDVIDGGGGNDFISGDRGNDTETGGPGADTFNGFAGIGMDRITDFNYAEGDRIQLDPGTHFTVSQVGSDTVIDMGNGDQMILVGVSMSTLTGNWIFGA